MKKLKIIGKCQYCKGPIYSFQKTVMVDGELYHNGN